ncbi:hypothetical protein GR11A_00015 [Vibrio phage vB_VcorM_GR11A]|nr:hypothetical protein GR11A_00015 [Vibrio phage vB_VcorM_GR11A]
MTIKQVDATLVALSSITEELDTALAEHESSLGGSLTIEEAATKAGEKADTAMSAREQQLLNSVRKLRNSLREVKRKLRSGEKDLPIGKVCAIINDNLTNRSVREACNVAVNLYGPGFVEALTAPERVKVCETILQFFDANETTPPLAYWRMVLNNDGKFD